MKTCSFFGHSHSHVDRNLLFDTTKELIQKGCEKFLIGNHGNFDRDAFDACLKLKKEYPNIK